MSKLTFVVLLWMAPLMAQLTPEQKESDFRFLASVYAKNYPSIDWKRQLFGFDGLSIRPWLDRVARSKDDLEFYEICAEYLSNFRDSHIFFAAPSDFSASLGMAVDIYDGKVLIEGLNRTQLPVARFPFTTGDELVSIDGTPVEQLMDSFAVLSRWGNEKATRRAAAAQLVFRSQQALPRAVELADTAEIVVRRLSGAEETYTVPWLKRGTPMHVGPVPSPRSALLPTIASREEDVPGDIRLYEKLTRSEVQGHVAVQGFGSRTPVFALPANFQQRLGRVPTDFFFSGTYQAQGKRIGFLRIPSYSGASAATLTQLDNELLFLEENTDGLIVDQIRNPGGSVCFGEEVTRRLTPYAFEPVKYEVRATLIWLNTVYNALVQARQRDAEHWRISFYEQIYREVAKAYEANRGLSTAIPLCTADPVRETLGPFYTKPIVMLIDEFSASTGDIVPAMMQDSGRATMFGARSNAAGATVLAFDAGPYSEAFIGVPASLMVRPRMASAPGLPASRYIENTGVGPDIEYEYMTRENLLQRGQPYVQAFTNALIEKIEGR